MGSRPISPTKSGDYRVGSGLLILLHRTRRCVVVLILTALTCLSVLGGASEASALSGQCPRAGMTKTVRSVQYQCRRTGSKLNWAQVKARSSQTQASASTTTTLPAPRTQFRTLTNQTRNTSFQIALQEMPEIAQSFVVSEEFDFNKVATGVYGLNTVKPEFFTVPFNQKSKYEESKFDFDPFDADVTVSIWRSDRASGAPVIEDSFDLASGFTQIFSSKVRGKVEKNSPVANLAPMNLELHLGRSVTLSRGVYVIVLGFQWSRLDVLTVRVWGQENGTNTVGGTSGDAVKNCTYTPTTDSYPEGRAYMGLGVQRWNGDPASSIGFGTRFRLATAKVTSCIVKGEWGNDIFNPGDLDIALIRSS